MDFDLEKFLTHTFNRKDSKLYRKDKRKELVEKLNQNVKEMYECTGEAFENIIQEGFRGVPISLILNIFGGYKDWISNEFNWPSKDIMNAWENILPFLTNEFEVSALQVPAFDLHYNDIQHYKAMSFFEIPKKLQLKYGTMRLDAPLKGIFPKLDKVYEKLNKEYGLKLEKFAAIPLPLLMESYLNPRFENALQIRPNLLIINFDYEYNQGRNDTLLNYDTLWGYQRCLIRAHSKLDLKEKLQKIAYDFGEFRDVLLDGHGNKINLNKKNISSYVAINKKENLSIKDSDIISPLIEHIKPEGKIYSFSCYSGVGRNANFYNFSNFLVRTLKRPVLSGYGSGFYNVISDNQGHLRGMYQYGEIISEEPAIEFPVILSS